MIRLNTWYEGLAPGYKRYYFYKNKQQYVGVEYDMVRDSLYCDFWDEEVISKEKPAHFDLIDAMMDSARHLVIDNIFEKVKYLA